MRRSGRSTLVDGDRSAAVSTTEGSQGGDLRCFRGARRRGRDRLRRAGDSLPPAVIGLRRGGWQPRGIVHLPGDQGVSEPAPADGLRAGYLTAVGLHRARRTPDAQPGERRDAPGNGDGGGSVGGVHHSSPGQTGFGILAIPDHLTAMGRAGRCARRGIAVWSLLRRPFDENGPLNQLAVTGWETSLAAALPRRSSISRCHPRGLPRARANPEHAIDYNIDSHTPRECTKHSCPKRTS